MKRGHSSFADPSVVPWARSRCLLLTTYRRDGTAVASPVWFVTDEGQLRLWTDAASGKVKRLGRDPRCTVAPCTSAGRATGAPLAAEGRSLPDGNGPPVQALLRSKYPIQKRALDTYTRARRLRRSASSPAGVYLAITIIG